MDSGSTLRERRRSRRRAISACARIYDGLAVRPVRSQPLLRRRRPGAVLPHRQPPDYHRPGDTADKIDAAGMARVAALGGAHRRASGHRATRPVYATVARPQGDRRERGAGAGARLLRRARRGRRRSPTACVWPRSWSAARRPAPDCARATCSSAFADRPVDSFDDLLAALRGRQPGDAVRVLYLRDGDRARHLGDARCSALIVSSP